MVSHWCLNTSFHIRTASLKNRSPLDQNYQNQGWRATPGRRHSTACRRLRVTTSELKQLTGDGRGGECQGGEHFPELKTLNKQEINIQYFYKLQHYEPVGHITQKNNLQYLQFLILKKFSKNSDCFAHSYCTKFYKKGEGNTIAQTFGSVDKENTIS